MNKLKNLKCITPLAFGGHGKDYIIDLLADVLDKETKSFSFSDGFKYIIAESMPEELLNNIKSQIKESDYNHNGFQQKEVKELTLEEKYHLNEYLKNDRNDITVFGDLNMREIMIFLMGKNFIQKIDPFFKVKLTCLYGIENYNDKTLFVANSTRYEEEILFTALLNTKSSPTHFFKDFITLNKINDPYQKVSQLFLNLVVNYDLSNVDTQFLQNLNMNICKSYEKLENNHSTNPDKKILTELKDIKSKLLNTNKDSVMLEKYGIIHVFRSLLPRINNIDDNNYLEHIKTYNKLNDEEFKVFLYKYKKIYSGFNLEFNLDNVFKYGAVRVNPLDASENALNAYKRKAILNVPDMDKDTLTEQLNKIFNKKKYKHGK